jgi:hypothetical protein
VTPPFRASPSFEPAVEFVGVEQAPVIVIDEFWLEPGRLVAMAGDAAFIDAGSVYPGVRAPAPAGYVASLLAATAGLIERVFGAAPAEDLDTCAFSMVTKAPATLRPLQRIPHFDGPEPGRLAFLHYLCAPRQGGTSFYRHRATGLSTLTPDNAETYRRAVAAEISAESPPPGYARGDSPGFQRLHGVAAAFNRLVIYPGNLLHSGDIGPDTVLAEDPRLGRLTINGFGFLSSSAASSQRPAR